MTTQPPLLAHVACPECFALVGHVWRYPKHLRWEPEWHGPEDVRQERWPVTARPTGTLDALCRRHGQLSVDAAELIAAARGELVARRRSGIPVVRAQRKYAVRN